MPNTRSSKAASKPGSHATRSTKLSAFVELPNPPRTAPKRKGKDGSSNPANVSTPSENPAAPKSRPRPRPRPVQRKNADTNQPTDEDDQFIIKRGATIASPSETETHAEAQPLEGEAHDEAQPLEVEAHTEAHTEAQPLEATHAEAQPLEVEGHAEAQPLEVEAPAEAEAQPENQIEVVSEIHPPNSIGNALPTDEPSINTPSPTTPTPVSNEDEVIVHPRSTYASKKSAPRPRDTEIARQAQERLHRHFTSVFGTSAGAQIHMQNTLRLPPPPLPPASTRPQKRVAPNPIEPPTKKRKIQDLHLTPRPTIPMPRRNAPPPPPKPLHPAPGQTFADWHHDAINYGGYDYNDDN
ncbi:hypothetical protein H0H93_007625 [Arthromyces matolae]|nr:hypothetical protein H0H93_007625 [Arthromyces matolae]